ncbi:hypothetical protein L210DRAFT_3536581 [Boletus edulis BED1]|uniref:Uncharacterized protein n=1 Tax=Boletus edulis BED1 TaxID=1328754 RepID=A0AAD4BY96_BOLED|nr:hypothetical protein L210DRAFT_3536581 [Boletus edulis BED1]
MQPSRVLRWKQRRQSDGGKRKRTSHSYVKRKKRLTGKRESRKKGDNRKRRIGRLRGVNRLTKRS